MREAVNSRGDLISRRELVRAASSLVFATGGLLVPATGNISDAREGSLGGKLGGRRGRNRRAQNKRRDNRSKRKSNNGKAPGASGPLYKWVGIRGQSFLTGLGYGQTLDSLDVDCYYRIKGEGYTYSSLKLAKTVAMADSGYVGQQAAPGSGIEYYPERYRAALMLRSPNFSKPIFLEAGHDPGIFTTPWLKIWTGGSVNSSGDYTGGTLMGTFDPPDGYGCGTTDDFDLDSRLTYSLYPSQSFDLRIRVYRSCEGPTNDHKIFRFVLFPH